jgi:hypothetical protein
MKRKRANEENMYLGSLSEGEKSKQECFIRDSGISPGFLAFLKHQNQAWWTTS